MKIAEYLEKEKQPQTTTPTTQPNPTAIISAIAQQIKNLKEVTELMPATPDLTPILSALQNESKSINLQLNAIASESAKTEQQRRELMQLEKEVLTKLNRELGPTTEVYRYEPR